MDTGKNILKNKGESDRKENLINIVTSAILRKSLPTHQTKGSNHKWINFLPTNQSTKLKLQ